MQAVKYAVPHRLQGVSRDHRCLLWKSSCVMTFIEKRVSYRGRYNTDVDQLLQTCVRTFECEQCAKDSYIHARDLCVHTYVCMYERMYVRCV